MNSDPENPSFWEEIRRNIDDVPSATPSEEEVLARMWVPDDPSTLTIKALVRRTDGNVVEVTEEGEKDV